LSAAVKKKIASAARYELQAKAGWLIEFGGTTVELSEKLGITGQAKGEPVILGSAIIVPITGYYGRGPTDMWEWLKTRVEK